MLAISGQDSLNTRKLYYSYETIPLRLFFDIIKSGDLKLLKLSRSASNDKLDIIWEEIIKRNNEANGNFTYSNYLEAIRSYARLINEYTIIKACVLKLAHYGADLKVVDTLRELGYVVNIENGKKAFDESLLAISNRSNNLVTKILAKKKEIEKYNEGKGEPVTFARAIMSLSAQLGYNVGRDITLEEYNEAKKLVKSHGRNNQRRRDKGGRGLNR